MRTDTEIQRDVEEEIRWDPDIYSTDIAVVVKNGFVSLLGFVPSYNDKYEAEKAAKRLLGVHGIANDLEVRLSSSTQRPDPEIGREAVALIKGQLPNSWDNIKIIIKEGWVVLEGEVEWFFQRDLAEKAITRLLGVKGITNQIRVKSKVSSDDIKFRIIAAFHRSAQIDADKISVTAKGSAVTLKGNVHTWAERDEAQRATWTAPGVTVVDNQIHIT